jgi:thiol-disulfide isomerase/thioredoxin
MSARIGEHKTTLVVLCTILLGIAFVTYQFVAVNGMFSHLKNDLKIIEPEIEAAYLNLAGEPVSLATFKGNVLVVNSWATWSPFSKDELVALSALQSTYQEEVTVLAINRKEPPPIIRAYINMHMLDSNAMVYLSDPTDHFYTVSGGYAMPETIVYAKDGTIAAHIRGTLNKTELETLLQTLTE